MTIDFQNSRQLLQEFKFNDLFIYQLGWNNPSTRDQAVSMVIDGESYTRKKIAELSGVVVFEITAQSGKIPNSKTCEAIYREISPLHRENLLIFLDGNRNQSLWYWVKQEGTKIYPRDHVYSKMAPCDLLLGKISALKVDLEELETVSVIDIAQRLQTGFDVERVTKKFFEEFKLQHTALLDPETGIQGISKEVDRRWYASVLLNRLMFVYFLQRKSFIDGGKTLYLQEKLKESQQRGEDLFYQEFMTTLFFEGFGKPKEQRSDETKALIGDVKYLNGGLFLKHQIEQDYSNISIPDAAFENVFDLFARYSWNLDDTVGGKENEINPAVLGYIFEKYINQKAFGAYYTRPEITEYLCDRTINKLILDRVNEAIAPSKFESINELLTRLDANLCRRLLNDILPNLSLLDPACGSGAFLVAAMKTLTYIYSEVIARIEFMVDHNLTAWLRQARANHRSLNYFITKEIITKNLFGVDIMPEATEIAKLRLFLALVSCAHDVDELEPLPNIDFNIMAGNSLIGLMQVNDADYDSRRGQLSLFSKTYSQLLEEKSRLIATYRQATSYSENLQALRDEINAKKAEALATLDDILLGEFKALKIKYEQAQLTGKAKKRDLTVADIKALQPFHWGYEFHDILQQRGGFDAIITNPPWEIFKPYAREFFVQHNELVIKSKMDIKDFEKEQKKLLQDAEIASTWLEYQSQYPHVSAYYRSAEQYKNQISLVNGKKAGTDINLYKLFVEQCFNLLRPNGESGIIIPSGVYTDLGTKQLREMLFSQTNITELFGLSNERFIFEGVDHRFKICLLTFEKGRVTDSFMAAFRIDPREAIRVNQLDTFFNNQDEQVKISVPLIRRLSPDSLSVMEFKNKVDIHIAEKMTKFPLLGEKIDGKWTLRLTREFDMTNDSHLFKQQPGEGRLPLYEGKMIHQFTHCFESTSSRYWVDEKEARAAILGKKQDIQQKIDYQDYRLGFRKIARNTDIRTMISTIIPPNFCSENFQVALTFDENNNRYIHYDEMLVLCALWNSFIVDFMLRQRISANINFFYVYQLPIPRLTTGDKYFNDIVQRAAKLICTTPEFDELAQEVGAHGRAPLQPIHSHKDGVTDETERAKLRAELDGIIAHLYGLTEAEFTYILTTFPIVPDTVKQAAIEAYRTFAPMSGDAEIVALIAQGESAELDFKASAWWDIPRNKKEKFNKRLSDTVAAFLNVEKGGTLLIGVDDDASIVGIEYDYNKKFDNRKNRDVYENNLMTALLNTCGKDCGTCIKITFGEVEGKDICKITVSFSPRPVYIKDGQEEYFYIRAGNSNRALSVREATDYIKNCWG